MRFAKIRKSIKTLLFLAAVFICGTSVTARAEEAASIKVFYHGITHQETTTALPGAEFVLFRAGSYVNGQWTLEEPFAGSGVSLNDMSASGQLQAAKNLYEYARKNKLQGTEKVTDQSGCAVFDGLEEGLYLISQKQDLIYHDGKFRSAPFLVSIPLKDDNGDLIYQVTVEPKSEWAEVPGPTATPFPTKKPAEIEPERPTVIDPVSPGSHDTTTEAESVKTGDNTPILLLVILLAVSAVAVIVVAVRKKGTHRHEDSDKK